MKINDYITPTVIQPTPPEQIYEDITSTADRMRDKLEATINTEASPADSFEVLKSRKTVIKRIRQILQNAEGQVIVTIPATLISTLSDSLKAAVNRGVFVLLLIFKTGDKQIDLSNIELDPLAHIVRVREVEIPVIVSVDHSCALVAPRGVITQPNHHVHAVRLGQSYIEPIISKSILNTDWNLGNEVFVKTACELPQTFWNLKHAVFQASLHSQAGTSLKAIIEAHRVGESGDKSQIVGQIVDIEQRIVNPFTTSDIGKCTFRINLEDGDIVSIGGPDAYLEDYGAYKITLDSI
ncbi:hypothetical protein A4G99_16665 [Haladaptatus sp. R4]|nr:hypothetical protein A4G99_16665 [Haladaptatus sp. R4]